MSSATDKDSLQYSATPATTLAFATLNGDIQPTSVEDAKAFCNKSFDYVVIGGGNSGISLATRLSEDPNVSVGVIEAGAYLKGDALIDVPGQAGLAVKNPKYDWIFNTTPQSHVAGRSIPVPRGKMLGGSSGLNFTAWDRAPKANYDAWRALSYEEGDLAELVWDWEGILPYLKKAENVAQDSKLPNLLLEFSDKKDVVWPGAPATEVLGREGPIQVSRNTSVTDNHPPFVRAFNEIGVKTNANPFGGDKRGIFNMYKTVNPKDGTRTYAAKGYYGPAAGRSNLSVVTGAIASRVLFGAGKDHEGKLIATGAEFIISDQKYTVEAKKEVLLCAGVIQTPQILELSGIGNPKVLNSLGIETLIDLPNVGENMQDHVFVPVQVVLKEGFYTLDRLAKDPEFLEQQKKLFEEKNEGDLATKDASVAFIPLQTCVADDDAIVTLTSRLEKLIAEADTKGQLTPLLRRVYEIQLEGLKSGEMSLVEFLTFSRSLIPVDTGGKDCFAILAGIQQPFSRGSVHIDSADPLKPPVIDPKYLSWDFDVEQLVAGYRTIERLIETKSLQSIVDSVAFPMAKLESDEAIKAYICQTLASGSHEMGTASMARKDLGGVVSSSLRVHGAANLRIADSSIIPIPIEAHLQSTVYAIAEKAADLIKKGL